jgi:hypothetical protein
MRERADGMRERDGMRESVTVCVLWVGVGGVEYKGGVCQIYLTFFNTFLQVSSGAEFVVADSSHGSASGK